MTISELSDYIAWTPSAQDHISLSYAARSIAWRLGLRCFRNGGRMVIECADGIAELYWLNRAHTMIGAREARCIEDA